MDVNNYGEILRDDHLHGIVEILQIFGRELVGLTVMEHGLRIDAKPNVIEAHLLDEDDVGDAVPSLEMFFGVAAWIVDLREPFAEVDAVAEMLCAAVGEGGVLRECGRGCECQDDDRGDNETHGGGGDALNVRGD